VKRLIFILLSLVPLTPSWALAHHSVAPYNTAIYFTIEGTVKNFIWSNPHVQLVLLVPGPDGAAKEWSFESASISRLASSGFNHAMVAPGDKIKVEYNPKRGGGIGGFFIGITTPDGRNFNTARLHGPGRA
jgi:hypothetical protein